VGDSITDNGVINDSRDVPKVGISTPAALADLPEVKEMPDYNKKYWTLDEAKAYLTEHGVTYTRADYMAKVVDHNTYYEQFATPAVIRLVKFRIGADRIEASTDPYFNDIPLPYWDRACGVRFTYGGSYDGTLNIPDMKLVMLSNMFTSTDPSAPEGMHGLYISPSDCISVLKAAARKIKEGRG
jgi:hypothetical protein